MLFPPNSDDPHAPKLELTYPCPWTYTVIGTDEVVIRSAIAEALGDVDHAVDFSHESRTGKYVSLKVEVEVESEEQRLRIYRNLHEHDAIKYTI